ncbi:MAG: hypothetical protein ACRCT8_11045 [Lacipirellulaceae bacterium]
MAIDSLSSLSPSDSGLIDPLAGMTPGHVRGGPEHPVRPQRPAWAPPTPAAPDAARPEESLREVSLPQGFMSRLRRFVAELR